jgi:hypothetical protein
MKLKSGREIAIGGGATGPKIQTPPARVSQQMETLGKIMPWAILGYAPYLKECWDRNAAVFLNVVDKRVDAIVAGLRSGSLVVKPDGGLAVTIPYFSLPEISMRVDGSRGSKGNRVYEVKG